MVAILPVDLGNRSYDIMIGPGLLEQAGALIAQQVGMQRALLVSNPLVFSLYGEKVLQSMDEQGMTVTVALMPDGERFKNIKEAMKVLDQAVRAGLERFSPVIALGGGVVGDLAGFVSAIYQRGTPLVQIPTTLLAQVDSSVGGKVAVNHRQGKNLIGAFHQPRLVLIDTCTLNTLTPRDYRSGLGEVVKYGMAFDAELFSYIEQHSGPIIQRSSPVLAWLIECCCRLKSQIVARDEHEQGLRMSLNLGHTFGHALEKLGHYNEYTHGEAVVMGTMAAACLACHLGLLAADELMRLNNLYDRLGLRSRFPDYSPAAVYRLMQKDKKVSQGKMRLILPEGIGNFAIRDDVSRQTILQAINMARDK
ncbi:MAG: 3-dehydroquinate synthase [Syntrophomonadaceae bacterium]|jgi:3-dehydroquinate synthase